MPKRRVAVFDIDGTIFRSSLLIELVEDLVSQGLFPVSARKTYNRAHQAWLDREGAYEEYLLGVIRAFDRHVRGVSEKDFIRAVERVGEFHQHRVYRFTRDLTRDLKRKGYFLLAISHSPKYVVDRFAEHLGFDKIYGRLLELDPAKKFTGRGFHLEILGDKAKVLARAVEKENLTLRGSIGVGDTASDIAFLKMVDRPICFNPNAELYAAARKNGWRVVVERKDVIYTVTD